MTATRCSCFRLRWCPAWSRTSLGSAATCVTTTGRCSSRDFPQVVSRERFLQLWQDIRRLLQCQPEHRHDLIELTKMPEMIGAQANPFLALLTGLNPSNAYVADLYGQLGPNSTRASGHRRRGGAIAPSSSGSPSSARFGSCEPQDRFDIECTVEMLAEQKARSFARMGVANMFARPGWQEFYIDVATNSRTRDLVHVSRLDVGPFWSAINLGLVFRDSYYHVLASYDDGELSRFGPGAAHLRDLLRFAIERGLKRFDFTIGDERYKLEWSDHKLLLHDHVAATSLRGRLMVATVRGRRRVKRLIKQNEVLWSLFGRLRTTFGSRSARRRRRRRCSQDQRSESRRRSRPNRREQIAAPLAAACIRASASIIALNRRNRSRNIVARSNRAGRRARASWRYGYAVVACGLWPDGSRRPRAGRKRFLQAEDHQDLSSLTSRAAPTTSMRGSSPTTWEGTFPAARRSRSSTCRAQVGCSGRCISMRRRRATGPKSRSCRATSPSTRCCARNRRVTTPGGSTGSAPFRLMPA